MITYEIKINNVSIKKIDIVNLHEHSKQKGLFVYEVNIYDFQNKTHKKRKITHTRNQNEGILLSKALS